jgi:hypothetical protein
MAGGPPFLLTVNGSNFLGGQVTLVWNGGQQITSISSGTISHAQAVFPIDAALIANPGNFSIAVVDGISGNQLSNALTLTVTPRAATACALFGTYHYLLTGFDKNGPMLAAGGFGVDAGGNVVGEYGFGDPFNPFLFFGNPAVGDTGLSGQCTNGATPNQGTLTLSCVCGFATFTYTYTFIVQEGGGGRLVESNDPTGVFGNISGSGFFAQVIPDSMFNGDYAFGVAGTDGFGDGGLWTHTGAVGAFTLSNGNLNGFTDVNDGGTVISDAALSGPPATNPPSPPLSPDAYSIGRLNVTIAGLQDSVELYMLVTSPTAGFLVAPIPSPVLPPGTPGGVVLGGIVSSQVNGDAFGNSSLNAPLVFTTLGAPPPLCCTTSTDTALGLASSFNSAAGTFNLQLDSVSGGVASLNQTITGATYSVATNGRATVSYTSGGKAANYVYYLDDANDGFILGLGNTAEFGLFHPQAAGPLSTASINGTFASATFLPLVPSSPNLATEITLNNGNLSASTPSGALSGTYSVAASGRGAASVNLPVLGGSDLVFYVISPSSVVLMGSDNTATDAVTLMHF